MKSLLRLLGFGTADSASTFTPPRDATSTIGPGVVLKGELRGDGVIVFQAGTREEDGRILADGGRVLAVTASGDTVAEAQARAYQGVDRIDWPEGFCRRDIGWRAAERERGGAGA